MTHAELVEAAARWLRQRCPVVITEMSSGAGESPDAIGFCGRESIVIECKASRSDFRADHAKRCHRSQNLMGDTRYYCVPSGLIKAEELPPDTGLLYAHRRGADVVLHGRRREAVNRWGEIQLLVSALRRTTSATAQGVSVKCYVYQTKCRATLGVEPEVPGQLAAGKEEV